MRKKAILLLALIIGVVAIGGMGFSLYAKTKSTKAPTVTIKTKVFTLAELKKYDGKNGHKAYVAVDGVVYDVTNARGWRNGIHQGYSSGKDLTKAIKRAPHGKKVLKQLEVVGKLK